MKLVVVGRGLAAMGLLWNVAMAKDKPKEIYWIAQHNKDDDINDPYACSMNTTALVALQGVKKNTSAFGDFLHDGYFRTVKFFEEFMPDGVNKLERLHLTCEENPLEELQRRFGAVDKNLLLGGVNLGDGIQEECFCVEAAKFLLWFQKEIESRLPQILKVNDWILDINRTKKEALGYFGKSYKYDKLALCTGALGSDFPSLNAHLPKKFKKSVGHFLQWDKVNFSAPSMLPEKSFVLTWRGVNFIYHAHIKQVILGGSSHSDNITAARVSELNNHFSELIKKIPILSFCGDKSIRSGVRAKSSRRMPILNLDSEGDILSLNGFYKNGWSLSQELGRRGAALLLGSEVS